jgi:SAM-dependent methyltransferase
MAHLAQQLYIKHIKLSFPQFFRKTKVLEVGSLNINGTVRVFFEEPEQYVGCDLGPGTDVDIVSCGHELQYPNGSFDVSISCECFEHDSHWQKTFRKMWELTRPEGLVVFSCATEGRPEHGTSIATPWDAPFTNDYYHNLTAKDFIESFILPDMFSYYRFFVNNEVHDLYFLGICQKLGVVVPTE